MNLERIAQSHREEKGGCPSASLDAMSRALQRVTQSPFSKEMEHTEMPKHFTRSPFTCYSGKTDVEHVSHHIQLTALYSRNDGLMCKVFPSSLGPTAMRWFNSLRNGSIHSFDELIQAFRAHFITCGWAP